MVLAFTGVSESAAQVRGLLRDRVREAVRGETTETEKEVDEKGEPGRGETPPTPFQLRMEERMKRAMGMADLDFEDHYTFSSSMSMDVESYDSESGDHSEMDYTLFFNEDDDNFAMRFAGINESTGEYGEHLFIFDLHNQVMLMLSESEGEKTGLALRMDPDEQAVTYQPDMEDHEEDEVYDAALLIPDFSRTGRTKTISGYECNEYLWEDDSLRINIWVSPDAVFDYSRAWGYMGGFQALSGGHAGLEGLIMEYEFGDKVTQSFTKMVVKELNPDRPGRFDLTGYSVIGFGGYPARQEE